MGHSVIKCDHCGHWIMESHGGIWECEHCGWIYSAHATKPKGN